MTRPTSAITLAGACTAFACSPYPDHPSEDTPEAIAQDDAAIVAAATEAPTAFVACGRSTMAPVVQWTDCQPLDAMGVTTCTEMPDDHFVARPNHTDPIQKSQLVVFLPGSDTAPADSEAILTTATKLGFHTIGLSYDSAAASAATAPCAAMTSAAEAQACYAEHRNRRAYGISNVVDYPVGVHEDVLLQDAVVPRLSALLDHLVANDANGDWAQFFDSASSQPVYDDIIVVGWDFGADLAAHIASDHSVQATVLIDGVKDTYDAGGGVQAIAPLSRGETPGCRMWGVYDADASDADVLLQQWTALGMMWRSSEEGESVDADRDETLGIVQDSDRRFFTTHECGSTHESLALDAFLMGTIDDRTVANDPASCVPFVQPDYQLRELYEDVLCNASQTTCDNSHKTCCVSGDSCDDDDPNTVVDDGCDSLFAARILELARVADPNLANCDAPLTASVGSLGLGIGGNACVSDGTRTANSCAADHYRTPPPLPDACAGNDCLQGYWVAPCADGTTDCVEPLEPLEGEAICADGTRPMVFVEPATSGASNKWIFYLSGEGGPCHGENCWVSYRYKQPLMGDPGPALSMSTMHPDLPRGASIGGDGIASGSLADPTSDYNRVVFNRCSDAASGAIESVPIPDGIPATMECAFPGLVGANETRRSYAPTYHRGFYVMTAAFNTFDVVGGVDLDGNGSIDVPSLADATHVAIAGSSDAAYWVGVAGDHLADEVEAIAGDDVDVRLLLDGYFIGGLDNEARHTAAPPAGFNIFDAPYTTTGLCGPLDVDGDGVVEACSDAVYQAGGPLDVDTTYFERASMEVRGTLIDQSCLEFHALVGDGDAPCYDRSHVLMHHIDTPYGVFADQEDQKLYDSEVSYFEGNVAWGPLNPFLAEYRTRILETARDVEDFWSTQREEGAMANEDVLLLLRKARRAGQPISAAHHVYFGSDVRMNLPMTQCERLGGGASMVLDVVTIEDAVDEWITNPAAAQARVFEDAVNAAAAPTWWVTSNGACVAPL